MLNINETQQQWQDKVFESFLNLVRSPDGDFASIGQLGNALYETESFDVMIAFLSQTPQGKLAFEKRISLGKIDLQKFHQFPKNSLAYQYADHMIRHDLSPLKPQIVENDYQYLTAHLTETHDIWHVVTGSNTDILGEIRLEAFYVAQLYVSRFWLALLAKNLLKAVVYDIELGGQYLEAISEGWTLAKQTKPLFGIDWNQLWETPLDEIRKDLKLVP
ncbi:Coq4 family protein [Crocosphaera sp. UHCC 0190]|uniref:Coq4 family protein n=1 Tax=Crocosphaera sp. UHCC 0190 TaxID=3110246 RepID=UPI002B21A2D9|nr:Coq4 family protein [Crocosphaera sp. UHCC 0190]MEA5509988.1 Coq4 family protein [Crocosphaera sp. UHCC 0190]